MQDKTSGFTTPVSKNEEEEEEHVQKYPAHSSKARFSPSLSFIPNTQGDYSKGRKDLRVKEMISEHDFFPPSFSCPIPKRMEKEFGGQVSRLKYSVRSGN